MAFANTCATAGPKLTAEIRDTATKIANSLAFDFNMDGDIASRVFQYIESAEDILA